MVRVTVDSNNDGNFGAGDLFAIAQVQLEAGPVATPFEHRPIGMELQLCQRYCEIIADNSHPQQFPCIRASQVWEAWISYKVVKRAPPVLKRADGGNFTNVVFGTGAGQCTIFSYNVGSYISGTATFVNVISNSIHRHYLVFENASGSPGHIGVCDKLINGVTCFFDAEL